MDLTKLTPAQHGELRAHLLAALAVTNSVSAMRALQADIWRLAQASEPDESLATKYVLAHLQQPDDMVEDDQSFALILDAMCEYADRGVEDDEPYGPMWLSVARSLKDARQRLQATLAKEE